MPKIAKVVLSKTDLAKIKEKATSPAWDQDTDSLEALAELINAISAISVYPSSSIEKLDDIAGAFAPTVGGTVTNPANAVDGDTGNFAGMDAVGEYLELTFKTPILVLGIRVYEVYGPGGVGSQGDGRVKLEYYDGSDWHDLITNIPISHASSAQWGSWHFSVAVAKGKKLRVTCTAVETVSSYRLLAEVEIYGLCGYA